MVTVCITIMASLIIVFYDPLSKKFSLGTVQNGCKFLEEIPFGMLQKSKGKASFIGQVQYGREQS
jgi:hypothetical protein